jgi:tetratricopeptide (TPR) repeat protein
MEMERIRMIAVIANGLVAFAALSQISEEEILTLLERHEPATAHERINQAYRQHPNSAVAAYFYGMFENDGATANKIFQDVATRFRGTVYAERALFRLGQYHFAEGTYNRARQYFTSLLEQYPRSALASESSYYAAKSLLIIGTLPQAREELSRCLEKYPGTWIAKFAAEDLGKLQPAGREPKEKKTLESPPASKKLQGLYTVEAGAFDDRLKAMSRQSTFSRAGYPTAIKNEPRGRKTVYKVLVGDFSDRNQARQFADEIQRKYKIKCHVLKREVADSKSK